MDPNTVAANLHRTRNELRTVLLAGQPGFEDADVFPRSRTMRFLLDPARRGIATAMMGSVASLALRRRQRKRNKRGGLLQKAIRLFDGSR